MPELVLIDEVHLSALIPAGLPDTAAQAVAAALAAETFLTRLRDAVAAVVREGPALAAVRVVLSR
jgi:hypothetical protein